MAKRVNDKKMEFLFEEENDVSEKEPQEEEQLVNKRHKIELLDVDTISFDLKEQARELSLPLFESLTGDKLREFLFQVNDSQ